MSKKITLDEKEEISKNIFWDQIPSNARVVDLGPSFIAVVNGVKHLVCWDSQNASYAQRWLATRAHKDKFK